MKFTGGALLVTELSLNLQVFLVKNFTFNNFENILTVVSG